MSVFIMGPEDRAQIAALVATAKAYPISLDDLKRWSKGFDANNPRRQRPADAEMRMHGHSDMLACGLGMTYSLEYQPSGLFHHLSLSFPDAPPGSLPTAQVVQLVMAEFGMRGVIWPPEARTSNVMLYPEALPGGRRAINIMEAVAQ